MYKGGAKISEIQREGEGEGEGQGQGQGQGQGEREVPIPELPKTEKDTESQQQPAEHLYQFILVVLCDIYKTDAQSLPRNIRISPYVTEYLDFIDGHLTDMSLLNGIAFDNAKFKQFVFDMCNKLYVYNQNNEKLDKVGQSGGVKERALSPSGYKMSLVPSDKQRSRRSRGRHSQSSYVKDLLNSWFVQCIVLISLLGAIFCAYIAYVKFNHLVSAVTRTGSVYEVNEFIGELSTGISDGFSVYIWKTLTKEYNLVNNYYTTAYKEMLGKYLESSASTILEKAKEICVGPDVFTEGNSMIENKEVMAIVNKIVNAISGVFTFKDTGNCMSNTMKMLSFQEIERIKTVLSLKMEEISTHHNQISLYLQYAGFLMWPAILYFPKLFMRVGNVIMNSIRSSSNSVTDMNTSPKRPIDGQPLLKDEGKNDDSSPSSSPSSSSSESTALVPFRRNANSDGGRKSKARRLYRSRRVVTMKKKRKSRRSIRKN